MSDVSIESDARVFDSPVCSFVKGASPFLTNFFIFKVTGCCFGFVSVEELVSVENTHFAHFARYGRKINILK